MTLWGWFPNTVLDWKIWGYLRISESKEEVGGRLDSATSSWAWQTAFREHEGSKAARNHARV